MKNSKCNHGDYYNGNGTKLDCPVCHSPVLEEESTYNKISKRMEKIGEVINDKLYGCSTQEPMEEKKVEQYICPSYYDDNNQLQDCKCGKCSTVKCYLCSKIITEKEPMVNVCEECSSKELLFEEECENKCGYVEPYGFVPEAGCKIHDKPLVEEDWEESVKQRFDKVFPDEDFCSAHQDWLPKAILDWWLLEIQSQIKQAEERVRKEMLFKCEHNMIDFTFVGGWGGSVPPPNKKCTKCLMEVRF